MRFRALFHAIFTLHPLTDDACFIHNTWWNVVTFLSMSKKWGYRFFVFAFFFSCKGSGYLAAGGFLETLPADGGTAITDRIVRVSSAFADV